MTMVSSFFKKLYSMKIIDYFLALTLSLFLGVKLYLFTVVVLFAFDTLLSLITLKKRGIKFSFKALINGLTVKLVFYTPAIVSIYLLDVVLLGDIIFHYIPIENIITKFGTFIIIIKELISINRLTKVMFGKSVTEEATEAFDIVKKTKDKIKDILD